jgi:hypothetical protein
MHSGKLPVHAAFALENKSKSALFVTPSVRGDARRKPVSIL